MHSKSFVRLSIQKMFVEHLCHARQWFQGLADFALRKPTESKHSKHITK